MHRSSAFLWLVLAQLSCGGRAPPEGTPSADDAGSTTPPTTPSPACVLDPGFPAGTSVVACGLPPHVTLVGVDSVALYALAEAGAFYRIDKTSGERTLLYQATSDPQAGPVVFVL